MDCLWDKEKFSKCCLANGSLLPTTCVCLLPCYGAEVDQGAGREATTNAIRWLVSVMWSLPTNPTQPALLNAGRERDGPQEPSCKFVQSGQRSYPGINT